MRIISYNVNGIRAATGKGLIEWISTLNADVVCLQETKAQPDQMPDPELKKLGYHTFWNSAQKKGYSGVSTYTRIQPKSVSYSIGISKFDEEGRVIEMDFDDFIFFIIA